MRLCATVHLDEVLARAVWAEYVEDGLQAVALPQGINLVALVRHTQQAIARWRHRDQALAVAAIVLAGGDGTGAVAGRRR